MKHSIYDEQQHPLSDGQWQIYHLNHHSSSQTSCQTLKQPLLIFLKLISKEFERIQTIPARERATGEGIPGRKKWKWRKVVKERERHTGTSCRWACRWTLWGRCDGVGQKIQSSGRWWQLCGTSPVPRSPRWGWWRSFFHGPHFDPSDCGPCKRLRPACWMRRMKKMQSTTQRGHTERSCGGHSSDLPPWSRPVDTVKAAAEKLHQLLSTKKKETSTQSKSCVAPCPRRSLPREKDNC